MYLCSGPLVYDKLYLCSGPLVYDKLYLCGGPLVYDKLYFTNCLIPRASLPSSLSTWLHIESKGGQGQGRKIILCRTVYNCV